MDRKQLPNPFCIDVVTKAEQTPPADVAEIHREPFDLCQRTYDLIAAEHYSSSILLHGAVGCGKTHLLSRFRRWLDGEGDSYPTVAPAVFVAIRLQTAPSRIWRHIRLRLAEELTRKAPDGSCPLDDLLQRFSAQRGGNLQDALEIAEIEGMSRALENVLVRFVAGEHRRLCRAWLAGEELSDADLQLLNIAPAKNDEIEADSAEDAALSVALAIVHLSAPTPVVFCFDQVEALGISQSGDLSFALFSRMGAAMVDETSNVLIVSTILTESLHNLQDQVMRADYQRISKNIMDLQPLDLALGRKLIDSRLALVPELAGESPIPALKLQAFFDQEHGRSNARKLIYEARRLFAEWQGVGVPPPVSIPEFLQEKMKMLWAEAEVRRETAQADAVLADGMPAAFKLLGHKTTENDAGLTIGDGGKAINVVFVNQTNMRSLAGKLKQLLDSGKPVGVLRLVRDHRLPISANAVKTQERLRQIEERGGRLIHVEAEALAALDAMRQLLTAATSGDLSSNGDAIEAKTVREWLARNLPPEVQKLAAELLDEAVADPDPRSADPLLEVIARRKVMAVDEAAALTGWPQEKIEDYARTHPLYIRWFGGSRPVVCQAIAAETAKEIDHA
jgi:hypothetical protein